MDIEKQTDSNSPSEHNGDNELSRNENVRIKFTRKKKLVILAILAGISAYGAYVYLNQGPDPTTWESLLNDYKNTR